MDLTRVLIGDDEPAVREQLRSLLETAADLEVVGEAASGPETVSLARTIRPDVVLLDIRMPGGDGLSAVPQLRRDRPDQVVVMLTTFGEDAYVDRALGLGVNGFLLKSADPQEIIAGVRGAAQGGVCLSPRVAARVVRQLRQLPARPAPATDLLATLTARERTILAAVGRGRSNAEIAAEQFLTEGTVKGYVSTVFLRLGVRNRVEAAIVAHELGITSPGGMIAARREAADVRIRPVVPQADDR